MKKSIKTCALAVAFGMLLAGCGVSNNEVSEKIPSVSSSVTQTQDSGSDKQSNPVSFGDLFGKKQDYKDANVGDTIKFGHYEQDNDTAYGAEEIEWLVLAKEDDKMLVISQYGLDCLPYNTKYESVTWETCTLRSWMNDSFYNTAFSGEEQEKIVPVTNENPDSHAFFASEYNLEHLGNGIYIYYPELHGAPGGNATSDKIFCLSYEEALTYFESDEARKCTLTEYAKAQNPEASHASSRCRWWRRSSGADEYCAIEVRSNGWLDNEASDQIDHAVRPVLWILVK